MAKIAYRRITVDGLEILYREAGWSKDPTIPVLHGFPTAGHMSRDLMPLLADRFRLVAADLPGFGQSAMPTDGRYAYTSRAWGTTGVTRPPDDHVARLRNQRQRLRQFSSERCE